MLSEVRQRSSEAISHRLLALSFSVKTHMVLTRPSQNKGSKMRQVRLPHWGEQDRKVGSREVD